METQKKSLPIHLPTIIKTMIQLWWIPILFAVAGGFLGVFVALTFGKQVYRCRSIFLYAPKQVEGLSSFTSLSFDTHVSLIKLPSNLEKMGKILGISANDAAALFDVIVAKKQGMLTFVVETDSANRAFQSINTICKIFIDAQISKRKEHAMEYISAFQGQHQRALDNLDKSKKKVEKFISDNNIVDISKEKEWYLEKLVSIDMELQRAEVEKSAVELKLKKMKDIIQQLEKKVNVERLDNSVRSESLTDMTLRKERLLELIKEQKNKDVLETQLKFERKQLDRLMQMSKKNIVSDEQISTVKSRITTLEAQLFDSKQIDEWKVELKKLDEHIVPKSEGETATSLILKDIMLQLFNLELEQAVTDDKVVQYRKAKTQVETHLEKLADLQEEFNVLQRAIDVNASVVKQHRSLIEGAELVIKLKTPDFLQVSEPQLPDRPSKSNRKLLAIAVTFLFIAMGTGISFVLAFISLSIRSGGEAAARFNLELLGEFPDHSFFKNPGIISRILRRFSIRYANSKKFQRSFPVIEDDRDEFYNMSVKISSRLVGEKGWTIMLSDIDMKNGSNNIQHVAQGLATCIAKMEYRVLIADFTCPVGTYLDYITQGCPCEEFLKTMGNPKTDYLFGAMKKQPVHYISFQQNPPDLLTEKAVFQILQAAKETYHLVLMLAPISAYEANYRICSRIAEGNILVMMAGAQPFWKYFHAKKILEQEKCPTIGVVATGVRPPFCKPRKMYAIFSSATKSS